jgi:AraC-like DNA-binding protein
MNRWHNGQTMAMHEHDCLQIYHVIEGEFYVDTGEGWQQILPGHAHILPPGYQHALGTGKTDQHFSITFRKGTDERGLIQRIIAAHAQPHIQMVSMPAQLLDMLQTRRLLFDDMTQLRLIHLFDAYCLNLLVESESGETDNRKQIILGYLESKTTQSLTVDEIAQVAGMSRTNLQRFCSKHFHCGIRALHERMRMENAARILLKNNMPVSECAQLCGYPDIYTFSRSFKRIKNRSPQEFRQHASQTDC